MSGSVIHTGSGANAHKRKPVRRADDDALLVFLRPVLDQGADGHNKKPPEKAQRRQQQQHSAERQVRIARQIPRTVMPTEPRGINPYSIFPPERYPAAKLPRPIPIATAA